MDETARTEYPAMLAHLQPGQAVQTLNDRMKRINKINLEIADWLQERRRVEEQYVQGMRKLAQFKVPNAQSELGVFQLPWSRIIESVERLAQSHQLFADRVGNDVEQPLRNFHQRQDVTNMTNISNNLTTMARELDEARDRSDKLTKKGGKASAQKVDAASSKLEAATQQWESQAPFIFETLQVLDESRVDLLRDLLTQFQTHESDRAQRDTDIAVETLAMMLEISTEREVQAFVQKVTAGKAQLPPRTATRRSAVSQNSGSVPSTPNPTQPPPDDDVSEHNSLPNNEGKPESKLRRLGTMFGGRRRQSVHAGFGSLSPQKAQGATFGRLGSSHGRGASPMGSSSNLHESNRLSILPEMPDAARRPQSSSDAMHRDRQREGELSTNGDGNTNGFGAGESLLDSRVPEMPPSSSVNGNLHVEQQQHQPPEAAGPADAPPPSQQSQQEPAPQSTSKDDEGFTIRAPMNDPISEAQREAATEENDQLFKLNIHNKPIEEEDPEAAQAALSSVANTLKLGSAANRRSMTVRGRRDVRNTIYAPVLQLPESYSEGSLPAIPAIPAVPASPASPASPPRPPSSRPAAIAALASEASAASDTQSVRSGNSLSSAHTKHPELTAPGLNASIIETVSVLFEGGVLKSAAVAGEIAFANNPTPDADPSKTHEIIRINNFANLERIGPNRIFVHNTSPDQPDQFSLDVSHLSRTATAFSYRVFSEEGEAASLARHAPLLITPAWKPQGDKLGLLLQYQLNPECKWTAPVTLHNVVFVVSYEGRATGAQTKPTGTHLKDKHLVYWRLGDVTLTDAVQKIVCRIVGADGVEPQPGHVEARWEYAVTGNDAVGSGISISRLEASPSKEAVESDPFADENPASSNPSLVEQTWVDVPVTRKLVSGKYEAK
ncbi:Muniscin C-terminal mu homology domain-containing protein [Trichoderma longibrachiatum]